MASVSSAPHVTEPLRQQPKRRAKQNVNYAEPLSPELIDRIDGNQSIQIIGKRKHKRDENAVSSRPGMFLQLDSVPQSEQGHRLQTFLHETNATRMEGPCGFSNRPMVCQPCERLLLKPDRNLLHQDPDFKRQAKRVKLVGRLAGQLTPPESPIKPRIKLVGRLAAKPARMEVTKAMLTPPAVHRAEISDSVPRVSYKGSLYAVDTCAEPVLIRVPDQS